MTNEGGEEKARSKPGRVFQVQLNAPERRRLPIWCVGPLSKSPTSRVQSSHLFAYTVYVTVAVDDERLIGAVVEMMRKCGSPLMIEKVAGFHSFTTD